ncbi:uncharacterized protein N7518_000073 [Penicillium psychrosexuale]|uniref:uncharacterized protein n=1 Tax=Penicillium psychrosexuale TaxID=1002107 RepID=UPI0025450DF1|nr:uncharacterized protein N7518_000073 [Penicillium psychrosexuale]KAJ5803770.1 hypothetical protein N7518_000073 [Penicillium psychrosexuale]
MTGSGRWTRKPTAASSANTRGTFVRYGRTIVIPYTMIFLHSQCFDPEEILDSMPKLQNKSPTPQTESQYIPTQIKTVNSPTLPMTKECRKGATKYLKCNAKSRANPTQMSLGGEGERERNPKIFDNANPPAPSNPMHQNRRIPYTNAYQPISTNAETRHNAGLQYGQHKRERPVREWGMK